MGKKTLEQYIACQKEIREVCERHGIWIVGTCDSESILGEITMFDPDEDADSGFTIENKRDAFNWN